MSKRAAGATRGSTQETIVRLIRFSAATRLLLLLPVYGYIMWYSCSLVSI